MKLFDLENKNYASTALKENFEVELDLSKFNKQNTVAMLGKIKNLIKEAKTSPEFYTNQTTPAYMKLVFMEQALAKHYAELQQGKEPRIVVENEEVEKSQVILAAQDMVDSVQKMIEEVNDMLVKELPALVDSIQSEIGVNESEQFNAQANESLTALNQTLAQSKTSLQNALNTITGQGGTDAFGTASTGGDEIAVTDIGATETPMPAGDEEVEVDATDIEEPEMPPVGGAGRAKR